MDTRLLFPTLEALAEAVSLLQAGGLVAFPTDTVYGLGSLAFADAAVERIYAAKKRSAEKAIPVLIADISDLERVASSVPLMAARLAERFWPGPLTLVVPRHPSLPPSISSTDSVGVRLPDHPLARDLLRLAGPMAVTSANISGGGSPSSAQEALKQLEGRIPLILDGGPAPGGLPSTVVDCTGAEPEIVREGPIHRDQIMAVLIGYF